MKTFDNMKILHASSSFVDIKEVERLMSEAECSKENDGSQLNTMRNIDANEEAEQTSDNQYENTSKSTYCQTVPLNYFVRSSSTQTRKSMLQSNVAEKGTQTYITGDSLSKLMPPETVSTSSQTDAIDDVDISGVVDDYKNDVDFEKIDIPQLHAEINDNITVESEDSKSPQQLENQFNDSECSNEEFLATSGDESETDDECPDDEVSAIDEEIILTTNKSIQSQLKFIICEESIAKTFSVCLKCGSKCSVSIRNKIGSYCVISVSCLSAANHNISWPTAPLLNRLPALNLLMASSILGTGMDSNKTLRFMESMNIIRFKRRELSNLQGGYVIPAVYNVWKVEQQTLLVGIKGKPITIASDMQVDSPGHSGLLGAGSTLDVERNVILDTQVVKVFRPFGLIK